MSTTAFQDVEDYLDRCLSGGFFQNLYREGSKRDKSVHTFVWHKNQKFTVICDAKAGRIHIPTGLPDVRSHKAVVRNVRAFLKEYHDESRPAHRRVDTSRAQIKAVLRGNDLSFTAKVLDGDFGYAMDRLISFIHEIYVVSLKGGDNYLYAMAAFPNDPEYDI